MIQVIKFDQKNDIKKAMSFSSLSDPAGIRTQDPYIKSVLLYQLSYGISKDSKNTSDPAGIRTQDPYIKSVLLYQLSYGILCFFQNRMQNYENLRRIQNSILKLFLTIFLLSVQSVDTKAQNDIAKKADSLFSAKKYLEASKIYETIVKDNEVNKEIICLKLAYIYENLSNYPKTVYYLNNYYNLNPKDEVFEKMNKIALENKYSGFERSDLNFVLALYQQYYYFLVYFFLIIGVIILLILVKKKLKNQVFFVRYFIGLAFYLGFLIILINAPSLYKTAIVNKNAFLRANPSSASPIIGSLKEGNKINIIGQENVWLKVYRNKKVYFINKKDIWILEG